MNISKVMRVASWKNVIDSIVHYITLWPLNRGPTYAYTHIHQHQESLSLIIISLLFLPFLNYWLISISDAMIHLTDLGYYKIHSKI